MRYLALGIFLIISSSVFSQVTFTYEELVQLATNNLERKQCLEISQIQEVEIDSLEKKVDLLEKQLQLKDTIANNLRSVISNMERVDQLRENHISEQNKIISAQQTEIKKQRRKLVFWRIFTPVAVTTTAILAVIF